MAKRGEEILVLYASQMGNSRRAAEAFCDEITTKLSASAIQDITGTDLEIDVTPNMRTLDDFLKEGAWTRLVVIFVSSYGMGDAPKDGKRFRDFCEFLLTSPPSKDESMLTDLRFAICGLGNSSFRTFMENPKAIEEALRTVGAKRVGEFGQADADKSSDSCQNNVIIKWREEIWKPLAEALIEEPLSEEKLAEMQKATISLKY